MQPMQAMRMRGGFTLIEVLVALAILAFALAAAMRAAATATIGAEEARLRSYAAWVAQNRLAEVSARRLFPAPGRETGSGEMASVGFEWQQTTAETPNAAFRRVEVAVNKAGDARVLARLVTYVVQPVGGQ